ncbi:MAG: LPXTG cell wall anchor domain-containing protein [Vagococcus sp.]|uniref:LPXTG cell wall anchor domain-containing protein n=1 Tax=Vagococcus sp. TaxID=1933889 RepID=UPI002FC75985
MKKKYVYLLLSIMVVLGLFIISKKQVIASGAEGGQVTVPGKITFESESKKEKPDGTNDTSKKIYSVLPKTGENKANILATSVGLIFVTSAIFLKKKVGEKE